MTENFIVNHVV